MIGFPGNILCISIIITTVSIISAIVDLTISSRWSREPQDDLEGAWVQLLYIQIMTTVKVKGEAST